KIESITIP
ncbi:hypothetical protein DSL65_01290, partial [Metamycoplasma hominis]